MKSIDKKKRSILGSLHGFQQHNSYEKGEINFIENWKFQQADMENIKNQWMDPSPLLVLT